MISIERKFFAYLDEMNIVTILLPLSYHHGVSSSFTIFEDSTKTLLPIKQKLIIEHYHKYICHLPMDICFGQQYWIMDEYGNKTDLQIGAVIRTEAFDQTFYYDGDDLGVVYDQGKTSFKLWAPTAIQVKLKLRPPGTQFSEIVKMKRTDAGVWQISVNGDLECYQYSFMIQINQEWREAVDPYATAVTANGELGVIVDLTKTRKPKLELPPLSSPVDAIIYETHIRDFTIHPDSGVNRKGTYLGAGELNTKGAGGELTGLSYVKDLGVTHLQFLPFHDFAGVDEVNHKQEYNWGYNPLHFNAPEGSYSTNPSDPYSRIIELKQLVERVHQEGLRVIMDVVYNHVYIREESSFEKVVPGYYFRHDELGLPSNGTGVGNDLASERRMVRKFITDSIRYWIEEFHIDGFRFDLMGILDVETMNEVRQVCDSFNKEMVIIGEGWDLNTPLPFEKKAIIANQVALPRIGQFNDRFRDHIKGNTFDLTDKGYGLGNPKLLEAAIEAVAGSIGLKNEETGLFAEPSQSVNYVECHDNHTLWDKLLVSFPQGSDETRMRYHRLLTGMVILSQGIPFLHSGQEFFRTKQSDGNSYRSPDAINRLDWERKIQYKENVGYVKGLIQLRKKLSCFRMKTADEIRRRLHTLPIPAPLIGCLYKMDEYEVLFFINPSQSAQWVSIPEGDWSLLANHKKVEIYSDIVVKDGEIKLEAISINVLLKKYLSEIT